MTKKDGTPPGGDDADPPAGDPKPIKLPETEGDRGDQLEALKAELVALRAELAERKKDGELVGALKSRVEQLEARVRQAKEGKRSLFDIY